ncbi:uncharacterized protein DS421_14g486560 [Arachis hypogaea]|nr:uncharacterized protein DS421_14g486560 [Arachis hypogaea]
MRPVIAFLCGYVFSLHLVLDCFMILWGSGEWEGDLGKSVNELMESKGGKKKSSSSKTLYEAPLDYIIEDVRPHGGIKKFRTAAYSNCIRKPS